ncbi:MAG: type II toxin-antitoxin system Phd/YefM family antitoxin [Deltaproteobacteria bacterium]|nr:type II toxin-antitoxin system Phd/YefM family antitoxin [Deltaproteobacteria bacterium]
MQKANALKLRQSLGKLLSRLRETGEPILIEKGREPAAVLISLADYQKRFVDHVADQAREALIKRIKSADIRLPAGTTTLTLIRELRS